MMPAMSVLDHIYGNDGLSFNPRLREAEVLLALGRTVGEIRCHIGVSDQSYYRWRREGPQGSPETTQTGTE